MFGGIVGESVLPAVPNDVQTGACEDAYGVGVVVAAGAAAFAIAAAPMAAAAPTGTTIATGSTVRQATGQYPDHRCARRGCATGRPVAATIRRGYGRPVIWSYAQVTMAVVRIVSPLWASDS
jgi:hypothetical protein